MTKELEALERLTYFSDYDKSDDDHDLVFKALHRLESIDNATPSEALECLEKIIDNLDDYADFEIKQEANEYLETIKQALIQAEKDKKELENLSNIHPCKDAKNKAESFELILFKNVDLNLIRPSANAESYNSKIPYYRTNLTNNEFTFLKEIIRQSLLQKIEVEE